MGTCLVVIILTLPFLNPLLLNENTSQSTIRVPSDMHLPGVSVCSSFRRQSDEALALNVTHKDGFSPSSLFPTCLNVCFFAMQIRCAWLWPECCFWSVSQVHYLMQIHKCINTWSNFPFLHPQFLSLLYFSCSLTVAPVAYTIGLNCFFVTEYVCGVESVSPNHQHHSCHHTSCQLSISVILSSKTLSCSTLW